MKAVEIDFKSNKFKTFFLTWTLHTTCNYRCSYCPSFCHSGAEKPYTEEQVIQFCNHVHTSALQNGFTHFTFAFSGGEPTLFPGFLNILKYLYEKKIDVTFTSNGSRSLEFWKKAAQYINHCVLSYHPETADPEVFFQTAQLLTENCWLNVDMMMTPNHFESNIELSKKLNTLPNIRVSFVTIQKDFGGESQGPIDYSPDQISFLQNATIGFKPMSGVPREKLDRFGLFGRGVKIIRYQKDNQLIEETLDYKKLIARDENKFRDWSCWAGIESLIVNADGSVYRAYCHEGGMVGNIWNSIELPANPVQCTMERCKCSVDIEVNKKARDLA